MYWPLGSPRVFTTTGHISWKGNILESDDSANNERQNGLADASAAEANIEPNSSSTVSDSASLTQDHEEVNTDNNAGSPRTLSKPTLDGTPDDQNSSNAVLGVSVARNGAIFATITQSVLTVWQVKPTAVLASVIRSSVSISTYGSNRKLLIRPDSAIFIVETSLGYLITYSLATDPDAEVYRTTSASDRGNRLRLNSVSGPRGQPGVRTAQDEGQAQKIREANLRFRMVIKVDAGINSVLGLDDELVVATERPPAVQCIRWTPDSNGAQTSTELLSRLAWFARKTTIVDMVHDRPMNLFAWIDNAGKAYAVQRNINPSADGSDQPRQLFSGLCFHEPDVKEMYAFKAAINARFSLISVGCSNGDVISYTVKEYTGPIAQSHKNCPEGPASSPGRLNFLSYSPDGYCLFAGYENGWIIWSAFGKIVASNFTNTPPQESRHERNLQGVRDGAWIGAGSEIILLGIDDDRIWVFDVARSSMTGCFSPSNLSRILLQTSSGLLFHRGHDATDSSGLSVESSLWQHVQVPLGYIRAQWPLRVSIASHDGRYIAIAGRRGLAHYSVNSGRWKTFQDADAENEFAVKGGMCWHEHVLVAAVECRFSNEIRLYHRDRALDSSQNASAQSVSAPIVTVSTYGSDSLLVYTRGNIFHHYVFNTSHESVTIVLVGQIAFHGIIRAPLRVRAVSWIIPQHQIQHGDPARDVSVASLLFLVDGKLVLLQPSTRDNGEPKYDLRVIAHNVEWYIMTRAQSPLEQSGSAFTSSGTPSSEPYTDELADQELHDSLWLYDGTSIVVWTDFQDVVTSTSAAAEFRGDIPPPVRVPIDFYPLSISMNRGIISGVEVDVVERRDMSLSMLSLSVRTQLFLPSILRYHLANFNPSAALHLARQYEHLPYFPHTLEVLLHDVLDEEVDTSPDPEQALLPAVLSLLSSFPQYLDIVVQCTRKTELRSWRTLFRHLPPPRELFEESLQKGSLKTAGGYLLVLHTFEELTSSSKQLVRLLQRAREENDWDLCKELARFLMALDESGNTLRETLDVVGLRASPQGLITNGLTPLK